MLHRQVDSKIFEGRNFWHILRFISGELGHTRCVRYGLKVYSLYLVIRAANFPSLDITWKLDNPRSRGNIEKLACFRLAEKSR